MLMSDLRVPVKMRRSNWDTLFQAACPPSVQGVGSIIMPTKPQPIPPRRDADEPDDLREEIALVNERDKVYREQREAARPAGEVVERLLRRHPAS